MFLYIISVAYNVQNLDLSGNKDLIVETDTFSGLQQLKTLRLSDCGLKQVSRIYKNFRCCAQPEN